MSESWGTLPLMADKSAWVRAGRRAGQWTATLRRQRIVTCGIVELELLYSARTRQDVDALRQELSKLRHFPITRGTIDAALGAVVELSHIGSAGNHRVPPADAIIAACAGENGCAVLHYDRHYDRLAEVLAFESVWFAPAGDLG